MLWNQTLVKAFKELGFSQAQADPCLFYKMNSREYTIVSVVVDDLLIASKTKQHANILIKQLRNSFKIKHLGNPQYVIGIHIDYDMERRTLKLNQALYINNMAQRFGQQNSKPTKQPADPNTKLSKDMCHVEYIDMERL